MGGRVVALNVAAGEAVRTGQILLRLDASSQRAQLGKAERDVVTAEARRDEACLAAQQAQREYDRYAALAGRQIVSQNLVDQLESKASMTAVGCDAAGAAIESARATIVILDNEIAKTLLRAPFDGVIAELSVELGEYTTPSPPGLPIPPVMEIIDTTSIFISAPMDEVDSARVHPGQPVRATIDAYPGRQFPGTVDRVAPYVLDLEAQNRTVEIEVRLKDAEFSSALLPGTSADVEVILEVREDVLRIPTSALLEGSAVLLVRDGAIVRQELEIGLRNWDFTEVRGGLDTSDRIVTSLDRLEVQPGAEVVVAGDPPR
jgi:HlyD family secretion protein